MEKTEANQNQERKNLEHEKDPRHPRIGADVEDGEHRLSKR